LNCRQAIVCYFLEIESFLVAAVMMTIMIGIAMVESCSNNCNSSIRSHNILIVLGVLFDIVTRRQSLGSWNVVE